jgi:hypothetical protein
MEEVVLPIDDHSFWQGDNTWKFIASVSAPNGGTDEYAGNDVYSSSFEMPDVYRGDLIVQYKTNNYPQENYWEIRDINGDVVAERVNSDANTIYKDTLDLAYGCYTFHVYDSQNDGLSYWAWPNQGNGYVRLRENGGSYYETFNAEFGREISHGFSVGILANVRENETERIIEVYPNPNQGAFTLELAGLTGDYQVIVVNAMGQLIDARTLNVNAFHSERFNLEEAESGLYFVSVIGENVNEALRVVLEH